MWSLYKIAKVKVEWRFITKLGITRQYETFTKNFFTKSYQEQFFIIGCQFYWNKQQGIVSTLVKY